MKKQSEDDDKYDEKQHSTDAKLTESIWKTVIAIAGIFVGILPLNESQAQLGIDVYPSQDNAN